MIKKIKWILAALFVAFIVAQFFNPSRTNPLVKNDFIAATKPPPDLQNLFRAACYDCHSDETRWPWYSSIAPMSWQITQDVNNGRSNLNFSDWPTNNPVRCAKKMEDMSEQIDYRDMPLKKYMLIHRDARFTDDERKQMENWLEGEAEKLKAQNASQ